MALGGRTLTIWGPIPCWWGCVLDFEKNTEWLFFLVRSLFKNSDEGEGDGALEGNLEDLDFDEEE